MVVSFLFHCMTRKSHSGGEELGWRQNLWFGHSPAQLNAPQPHSSKMRAEQHLGGVCSVSDVWCSKAQHKHNDSQEPAWGVSKPRPTLRHAGRAGHRHSCPNSRVFAIWIVPIPWAASCVSFTLVTTAGMHKHLQCAARDISCWGVEAWGAAFLVEKTLCY